VTPISVVIITFNEEKNLERCLQSIQSVADDVVVVDSFSTDRTKEIAIKYNARFIQHVFEGHIEQKNWAITQAKFPHVLSLDADEAIDETLKQSILEAKEDWGADGYSMNRLNYWCGQSIRHGGWYPDRKFRLWDSRKGSWGGINPHDEYKVQAGCSEKHLKGDILHFSYYTINQHLKQVNYFTDILAQQYFEKGRKASWFKILINPLIKFIGSYFFQKGFLDGFAGFAVCMISAHATFLKYAKLRMLQKQSK
jgi:glycosyltransferase involved in cell wall biosynthesis